MTQLKHALRQYLGRTLGIDTRELHDDTELFSSGLVDALSVLELVSFIEHYSGVSITPDAVTLANFDSLARIERFVAELQGKRPEQTWS